MVQPKRQKWSNARVALMAHPTYHVLPSHHKNAWLEQLTQANSSMVEIANAISMDLRDCLSLCCQLSAVRFPSAVARASSVPNPPLLLMVIHIQTDIHTQ